MTDIYDCYCNDSKGTAVTEARFLTIYIEEAHARDEWYLPDSPNASTTRLIYTHKTIEDRITAAKRFIEGTGVEMEVVCETMEGNVTDRYGAWPERLYIIVDRVVVYQGGKGPFGYKLFEVKQWLANKFGMKGELQYNTVPNGCT